jgi:hypothetical protein
MCSYDMVGAMTWWSKDQATVMWSSACYDGVEWRCKVNSWSWRQRYKIGFSILHPRHHRGCGWLRIDSCTIKRGIFGAFDHLSATREDSFAYAYRSSGELT